MPKHTLVVGASTKAERYSRLAVEMLRQYGHPVAAVGNSQGRVADVEIATNWENLPEGIDTVTLYVGPAHQPAIAEQVKSLRPQRVIFNPGTENAAFGQQLSDSGIEVVEACTLVMLRTNQF